MNNDFLSRGLPYLIVCMVFSCLWVATTMGDWAFSKPGVFMWGIMTLLLYGTYALVTR